MSIHFHLKQPLNVPVECDELTPDQLVGASPTEISQVAVFSGRRQKTVGDLFEVTGHASDDFHFHGDLKRFRGIGRRMQSGSITVHGSCGMHCGAEMAGGRIEVEGSTDDWLGAEMKNGVITVKGDTGKGVGAAYLASASGMKNGTIIVHGNAGQEIGRRMRRGTIVVRGQAGDLAGLQMIGGTIILKEALGDHIGAWMKKGTIVCLQQPVTNDFFRHACDYSPTFLSVYAKHLRQYGIQLPEAADTCWSRWVGDASRDGRGELLVWNDSIDEVHSSSSASSN